jgi:histidinol-phosphate aminotransferase
VTETVHPDRVPVRDDLLDVTPYGAPQLDVPVRLNTNEVALPPPSGFVDEVAARMSGLQLQRYPDRRAIELRSALARLHHVTPDRVWVANGSNEIQMQLLQAYGGPGRRVMLLQPGYSFHPTVARLTGTEVVFHDLPQDLVLTPDEAAAAVAKHDPDIVLVASPHNPSGVRMSLDAVRELHDGSRALIVLDEAYVEFTRRPNASLELLAELPRLVLSRTFSKAFRLAGVRLGYLLAQSWVIDDLRKVRLPYHLDAITQVAGVVALEQRAELMDHIPSTVDERDRIVDELLMMQGVVRVWPSSANFLLLRTEVPDLFDQLLDLGVLVRDFSSVPGVEGCIRVTVGTPDENDWFLRALHKVVG